VRIETLIWDDWNEEHIAAHGISPEEVEEICSSRGLVLRRGRAGTYAVLGRTAEGRELIVFLAPRGRHPGTFYPVTARPMNSRERRYYRARRSNT